MNLDRLSDLALAGFGLASGFLAATTGYLLVTGLMEVLS